MSIAIPSLVHPLDRAPAERGETRRHARSLRPEPSKFASL